MPKVDVAGLKVDAITKREFLQEVEDRFQADRKTFVTTVYSEFLHAALTSRNILEMLNKADMCVADGIGIMWAAKFLSLPFTLQSYYGKIIQAFWQMVYSGASILFRPKWVRAIIPEKIVGADLVWDLTALAAKNHWTIFLVGGFGNTPALVAQKLEIHARDVLSARKYHKTIVGYSAKDPNDLTLVEDIKTANPDMVFVAYGPIKQEQWIVDNMEKLPAKFYIGLGGTFDYIAGKRAAPPKFVRSIGLEWFYRLFTQPYRYKRIFNGVVGLIMALLRHKVFLHQPYRKNAVSVVINKNGEVFTARFNPEKEILNILGYAPGHFEDYWQLPQGGLEEGEEWAEGAKRELWEETAIHTIKTLYVSEESYKYNWSDQERKLLVPQRYRYRGQEQRLIYFYFTGTEEEIHLDKDELLEYQWVPIDRLPHKLHKQKRALVEIIQKELQDGLVKLP